MRTSFLSRGLFILIFVFWACNTEKTPSYDLILSDARVVDLESGQVKIQDVLITRGIIQKLLPTGEAAEIRAIERLSVEGAYLLPGFWDNHVHFRGGTDLVDQNRKFLGLFLAHGITTVRDAGGDLTPAIKEWQKEIASGKPGPTIYTSGPKIDGPNPTWAGSLEVNSPEDIKLALDSLQTLGIDFVKLYDSRISGELYLETLRQTDILGLISSGHMPFSVTLEETVSAGIDAIEHLYYVMKGCADEELQVTQGIRNGTMGFWQAMPRLQQSYTDSTAQKTFDRLKANNVYVVPTLHIGRTLSYLDEADHSTDPYLNYLSQEFIKTYQGRINRALNASEQARKDRKALDDFFRELTAQLHQAGVGLLAGSDCGAYNSYIYPGPSLHDELEALVSCGLSELEALQASAYHGPRFLKKEMDYGNIAEGKVADLVVLSENPLEDIRNTRKIEMVIKNGEVFDRESLQNLIKPN
ncbi:MAG: amidohydrolase family protein [Eudoraea sp.]|nr:amidohydrolase family protein [Eudoraea sp.]